jgi:ring-1,2-phenylacetyl-CoA epoxidase subunit PaaD
MRPSGNQLLKPLDHDHWPSHDLIGTDRSGLPSAGEEGDIDSVLNILQEVADPEVPIVSVVELGIIRTIEWINGTLKVSVTPTYSGCPATEVIEQHIYEALKISGYKDVIVRQRLSPAWTTDWVTEAGREKLRAYGIAPPLKTTADKQGLLGRSTPQIPCPLCGSHATERVSEFGSTACKALYRCNDCLEPFDYFKCL